MLWTTNIFLTYIEIKHIQRAEGLRVTIQQAAATFQIEWCKIFLTVSAQLWKTSATTLLLALTGCDITSLASIMTPWSSQCVGTALGSNYTLRQLTSSFTTQSLFASRRLKKLRRTAILNERRVAWKMSDTRTSPKRATIATKLIYNWPVSTPHCFPKG